MVKRSAFQMPARLKIPARSSSITASFVSSVIPILDPTPTEVAQALALLGMSEADVRCAYCGDPSTEWDHLRPLVKGRLPTGYISEIANLVPSCGKCNQSKGNKPWREWMVSTAPHSPRTRERPDVEERMRRLEDYERWREPVRLDLASIAGSDRWKEHWSNRDRLVVMMEESQRLAKSLSRQIEAALTGGKSPKEKK